MTVILGLRSKHDASAALVIDGELVAAANEERFTRRKHHFGFPRLAIEFVLAQAGLRAEQVDVVARDGIPAIKTVKRLMRQMLSAWTPRLYSEVLRAARDRYIYRRRGVQGSEEQHLTEMGFAPRWHFVEHHLGHAAYSYYASGLEDALVVVLDGRGHYLGGAIYVGRAGRLSVLSEIMAEGGSLGLFYSAITDTLGFQVGDGDGKTMGLACYGEPQAALRDLEPFAPTVTGLDLRHPREWQLDTEVIRDRLYGHYREAATLRLLTDKHGEANLAASAQHILEDRIQQLVVNAVRATGLRQLVGGGGVFLNVKASKMLLDQQVVDTIYVAPGPGDEGLAAGYALAAHAHYVGRPKPLASPYLGPGYDASEVLAALEDTAGITYERLTNTAETTAELIANGQVVGWFQGRMEWGPRALGSRSVLADPRDPNMRDRINHLLKKRDWFMPFAPSVLAEYCDDCFVNYRPSPYMNLAFSMRPPYDTLVPAITHVDNTARPQAVNRDTNPVYYDVINAFRCRTGIPLILNTSFNRHGLPIVCTPQHAIEHLIWGAIDVLIVGSYLVRRIGDPKPPPDKRSIH